MIRPISGQVAATPLVIASAPVPALARAQSPSALTDSPVVTPSFMVSVAASSTKRAGPNSSREDQDRIVELESATQREIKGKDVCRGQLFACQCSCALSSYLLLS